MGSGDVADEAHVVDAKSIAAVRGSPYHQACIDVTPVKTLSFQLIQGDMNRLPAGLLPLEQHVS